MAVAGRDMGAFRMLYERHAGRLAVRLARRCNDRDLVADAVALLRGADGRVRFRVTRTLQIVLVLAAILLVLASVGGFPHAVTA